MSSRQRGSHGASNASLVGQFYKCTGCSIKIPVGDLEDYKARTSCAFGKPDAICPFHNGDGVAPPTQGDIAKELEQHKEQQPTPKPEARHKLWLAITNKQGHTYYHNTQTGADQWNKPNDYDTATVNNTNNDNGFVPFVDQTKRAVLNAQRIVEYDKLDVPLSMETIKSLEEPDNQAEIAKRLAQSAGGIQQSNGRADDELPELEETAEERATLEGLAPGNLDSSSQSEAQRQPTEQPATQNTCMLQ